MPLKIQHFNTDTPSEITFETSVSTAVAVPEGTEVNFTCSIDHNSTPTLLLIQILYNEQERVLHYFTNGTASVNLTKEQNGLIFMCRANGSEPAFPTDSVTKYSFDVQCKY